jgi:hypothetical protein
MAYYQQEYFQSIIYLTIIYLIVNFYIGIILFYQVFCVPSKIIYNN